jgi:hypothetical protein
MAWCSVKCRANTANIFSSLTSQEPTSYLFLPDPSLFISLLPSHGGDAGSVPRQSMWIRDGQSGNVTVFLAALLFSPVSYRSTNVPPSSVINFIIHSTKGLYVTHPQALSSHRHLHLRIPHSAIETASFHSPMTLTDSTYGTMFCGSLSPRYGASWGCG